MCGLCLLSITDALRNEIVPILLGRRQGGLPNDNKRFKLSFAIPLTYNRNNSKN